MSIIGIANSSVNNHTAGEEAESNPPMPRTHMRPNARVKAPVARSRWRFSSSLKCQRLPLW